MKTNANEDRVCGLVLRTGARTPSANTAPRPTIWRRIAFSVLVFGEKKHVLPTDVHTIGDSEFKNSRNPVTTENQREEKTLVTSLYRNNMTSPLKGGGARAIKYLSPASK